MTRSVEIPEEAVDVMASWRWGESYFTKERSTELGEPRRRMVERQSDQMREFTRAALTAALPYLAPAGDGGLREALEKLAAEWARQPSSYLQETARLLQDLLRFHPAAPAVPQPAGKTKPLREALDDWPEPEGTFDEVLERSAQARFSDGAVPQPVDREALRELFRGPNACGIWLENLLDDSEQEAVTDAVLAVLAGEQEQVEQ